MNATIDLPVDYTTCTVLGSRAKSASDPLWAGLSLGRGSVRNWPGDHHLGVPWEHPDDRKRYPHTPMSDWAIYRVRPLMEPGRKWKGRRVASALFKKRGGRWTLRVTFA